MRTTQVGAWRPRCAALGGAALLIVVALVPSLAATGASMRATAGLSTNYDFARLVLEDGGWPTSPNNVTVLTQWLRAEEPTTHWWDRDNPLNNGLGSGGGSGLGSYDSLVVAASDVAQNLETHAWGYPLVASDLALSTSPATTARAIWRSNWAAGHYGWGAGWDTSPVPSVPAPPVAWREPASCATSPGVVTTCSAAFTATGAAWHWAPLTGLGGDELWAFAGHASPGGTVTWHPALAAGTYEVEALVPAQFADAVAAYVVVDARGGHRVLLDEEPYSNTWVSLGAFVADASRAISVTLRTATSGSAPGTYLAASDMRFEPLAAARAHDGAAGPHAVFAIRPPGAPQDVTAVAAPGRATVSWLAPSKDGGDPITGYVVTALPGGHTCRTAGARPAVPTCTVVGLTDGRSYQFVVRARTRAGTSPQSGASPPVLPLATTTVVLEARGTVAFGARVVYRATLEPAPANGLVLFAVDGAVLPGCGSATVVDGHASCATRLLAVGHHQVLATFSGSAASAGAEAELALDVHRAATSLRAVAMPAAAVAQSIITLRAWGLPGAAAGELVFTSGASRLCAFGVRAGGGTCRFRLRLAPGLHDVVARYVGNHDFSGAVARTTLRVLVPPTP